MVKKAQQDAPVGPSYRPQVVLTRAELDEVVSAYSAFPYLVFDVETIGGREVRPGGAKNSDIPALDERTNVVLWIALAGPGRVDIIPMGHPPLEDKPAPKQLSRYEVLTALRPLFFDPERRKINHNVSFDTLTLSKHWGEIPPGPFTDTISLAHVLNENLGAYNLGDLVGHYLDFRYAKLARNGPIDSFGFWDVARYVGQDAKVTQLLYERLRPMYDSEKSTGLRRILELEGDVTEVLVHAKSHGALVDRDGFERINAVLSQELFEVTAEIFHVVAKELECPEWDEHQNPGWSGREFLITSTQQRAKLLYGPKPYGLELPCKVATEKGAQSTSAQALKPLVRKHAVVPLLLRHSELSKLRSTYTTGFMPHVADDGRIRTSFKQAGAATGRFSSARPNCFSGDTQVLTHSGWVTFDSLREGEGVAQWEDGTICFVKPTAYVKYHYEGPMVHLRTESWDQLVTPDHRMLSFTRRGSKQLVESAESWLPHDGQIFDRKVARAGTLVGGSSEVEGLHLAVLAQAEGSWVPWDGGYWDCSCKGERKKGQLLQHWPDRVRSRGSDRLQVRVQQEEVDRWLDPSTKTFRIEELLKLSSSALEVFLEWTLQWDGDFSRGFTFGQKGCRQAAVEAVQTAAVLTGHSTSWYSHPTADLQVVNLHRSPSRYVSKLSASTVPWDDDVYCLSVPSGFLLTRRNRDVLVVGQCQNIPRQSDDDASVQIRRLFVAPPGCALVVGDFGQIEYRVMAHFAGPMVKESRMLKAFREGIDLHTMTASGLFDVPIEQVTKEQRQAGKTANFAIMFGGGPNRLLEIGLAKTAKQADEVFDGFHSTYPEVEKFARATIARCRRMERPYVATLWGRRRRLPEINIPKHDKQAGKLRAYAERQAVNHIIQGTAADLNKAAMVRAFRRIGEWGYEGKMHLTLTVHDEIVLEVSEDLVEVGVELLREAMQGVKAELLVPLVADIHFGPTWFDAK